MKARRKIINSEDIVDGNVDYVCFINLNNSNLLRPNFDVLFLSLDMFGISSVLLTFPIVP